MLFVNKLIFSQNQNTNLLNPKPNASDFCLVVFQAGFLKKAPRLEKLVKKNQNGQMCYMENHFDKRLNPTLLVEDAKV
jgi:hypothetical protein